MDLVNVKLYDFLDYTENHIQSLNDELEVWCHVEFDRLEEFANIVGYDYLSEGSIKVILFHTTVCIDLLDVLNHMGENILNYKNKFSSYEWENIEDVLKEEW